MPTCRYGSQRKSSRDGSRYFKEKIEQQLDEQIRFVGDCFLQLWIWLGWIPNSLASSAIVRSPLIAATATLALNPALCFFRVRFMSRSCAIGAF
jgi:hypothetical protein